MPIAIVPAAGAARRMGRPKLLLPFGAITVLGATVSALRAGGADSIVLVHALGDPELAAWATENHCRSAVNPRPGDGMLSTILAGIGALGGAAAIAARGDALLVCPGDLPLLQPSTVRAVIAALVERDALLALPRYGDSRGHPLAMRASAVVEIPTLDPEIGLRELRLRHASRTVEVAVEDAGAVRDLDTPEDYANLRPLPDSSA